MGNVTGAWELQTFSVVRVGGMTQVSPLLSEQKGCIYFACQKGKQLSLWLLVISFQPTE